MQRSEATLWMEDLQFRTLHDGVLTTCGSFRMYAEPGETLGSLRVLRTKHVKPSAPTGANIPSVTRNLIVIGASAGGVEAAQKLAAALPAKLPASIFLVIHVGANGPCLMADIINRAGPAPSFLSNGRTVLRERANLYRSSRSSSSCGRKSSAGVARTKRARAPSID